MSTLEFLVEYRHQWWQGLQVTLALAGIIWAVGLSAGTLLGVAAGVWPGPVGVPVRASHFVLSAVPLLVVLFWAHYPLQMMAGVVVRPFATTAVTLSVVNVLVVGSLVYGVIRDFPREYLAAARVCGLTRWQTAARVQIPLIARQVLPGLLTTQVGMLQATLFASLISVDELFRVAQRINAEAYRPVEIYSALGLFFLAICLPLHLLAHALRVRYTRELSEV